ncbi:MAG: hypothetical protein M3R14_13630 [Acidobacteriota bacterium]|nr:hypothetical protein [Acidobacteriota bacterium]
MKTKSISRKKNFIDVLMKTSRFPEFRFRRQFTEFIISQFIAEAATKCLEVKSKYNIAGKPLTPKKAVEVCFAEGLYIDVEAENNHGREDSWFGKTEDGKFCLWINPALSLNDGQDLMICGLATFLLNEKLDLYFRDDKSYSTLEELCENPQLLKATMTAEVLTAMLLASETEAELVAFQSVVKQG